MARGVGSARARRPDEISRETSWRGALWQHWRLRRFRISLGWAVRHECTCRSSGRELALALHRGNDVSDGFPMVAGVDRNIKEVGAKQSSANKRMKIGLCSVPALQKCLESVGVQEIKRLHHYISGQMFTVVTYTDAPHTRAACSFDAGGGVFYNNAPVGRYADPRSRSQI